MTRREILEKSWKDFRLSVGLEYEQMSDKAYEFMENAMEQYAELRIHDVVGRRELLLDFLAEVNGNLTTHPHLQMSARFVDDYLKSNNCA